MKKPEPLSQSAGEEGADASAGMFPGPHGGWMLWTGVVWVEYRPEGWQPPTS